MPECPTTPFSQFLPLFAFHDVFLSRLPTDLFGDVRSTAFRFIGDRGEAEGENPGKGGMPVEEEMDGDVIGRVVRVGVVGRRWTGGMKRDDLVLATVGRLLFAHHDWIFIFLLALVACHLAWSRLSAGLFFCPSTS